MRKPFCAVGLVLVAACRGRSAPVREMTPSASPASSAGPRDAATVTGRLLGRRDSAERPLEGVTIAILGEPKTSTVTDRDGRFRFDRLPERYDLVALVPRPIVWGPVEASLSTERSGVLPWIFHDVTQRDLAIHIAITPLELERSAKVTLPNATPEVVINASGDAKLRVHGTSERSASAWVAWYGPPSTEATIFALSYDADEKGRAMRYREFGRTNMKVTAGDTLQAALPMQPVATRKLHVTVTGTDEGWLSVDAALEAAPRVRIPFNRPSDGWRDSTEVDVPVPAAALPIVVGGMSATKSLENWISSEERVSPDATSVTVRLPPRIFPKKPNDDVRFDHATPLGWTGSCGVARVDVSAPMVFESRLPFARKMDRIEGYVFVTARSSITFPDLRPYGARLQKSAKLTTRIDCHAKLTSVDAVFAAADTLGDETTSSLSDFIHLQSVSEEL